MCYCLVAAAHLWHCTAETHSSFSPIKTSFLICNDSGFPSRLLFRDTSGFVYSPGRLLYCRKTKKRLQLRGSDGKVNKRGAVNSSPLPLSVLHQALLALLSCLTSCRRTKQNQSQLLDFPVFFLLLLPFP